MRSENANNYDFSQVVVELEHCLNSTNTTYCATTEETLDYWENEINGPQPQTIGVNFGFNQIQMSEIDEPVQRYFTYESQ